MRLDEKMLVVIGGSSGVGLGLLEYFTVLRKNVMNGSRSEPCVKNNFLDHAFLDVSDEESVSRFFSLPSARNINGLVYCAGVTVKRTKLENFDKDAFLRLLDVNVAGFALTMKYAIRQMNSDGCRVVAIGSMATRSISQYSGFEYTASKLALSGLVRHFAQDLASSNVLVNSVHPGPINTPMLRQNLEAREITDIVKAVPTGRLASTDDINTTVDFLLSEKNKHINGVGIDVNGGQILTA